MSSMYLRQSTQPMRFVPSPRHRKGARWVADPGPASTSQCTGVTNMCFKNDESDDVENYRTPLVNTNDLRNSMRPSSNASMDSGCCDVTSPLTPLSDVSTPTTSPNDSGLYHRAMSRRKTISHSENETTKIAFRERSETSSGYDSAVHYNNLTATKRNINNETNFASKPSNNTGNCPDDVFFPVTSPEKDLLTFNKGRSMSWTETTNSNVFPVKPRSFSQPLLREVPGVLYNALADIDEEEILIDPNGISRTVKRRELAGIGDDEDGRFNMKSPLLEDEPVQESKVTIYPGHQQKAGMSLNEWQVSLGDKEPSKCRCDETPKPKPKPPPPPPAPLPSPPKPPSSESTEPYEYITGNETSIGGNTAMSAPEENEEIVGVEVEVGSSREMSPRNAAYVVGSEVDCPTASAGRQRKKSIRTIFRLGFLTTKSRKKNKGEDKTPSPDAGYKYPPANNRLRQRRISRLEMNEPIEDIFSEVKFETIPKRPSSANSGGGLRRSSADDDESDDDIMEDPEVIMQSFLKTNSGQVAAVDVTDDHHDAANKSEKELLLPEDDDKPCSLVPLCDDNRKEVSEEDLR